MKTRIIHTRIWKDSYVRSLLPHEKLVFIYLLTNEDVELTGAYEMMPEVVAFDLGLDVEQVKQSMGRFMQDKKICFVGNYVVLINHLKYQDYSKGSENQRKAFERELDLLPEKIQQIVQNKGLTDVPDGDDNQLATSSQLVGNYTEIRNKKTEIRNKKEGGVGETKIEIVQKKESGFSFSKFKEEKELILEEALEKYSDKDCERAIESFIAKNEAKNYKYKNYKLAFFNWVREDRFGEYSLSKTGVGFNGRPKLVIT